MNPNLTEIAFILDRSGSMQLMAETAVSSFNHLLHTQQEQPGDARLSLVLFDDVCEVPFDSAPISGVPGLDATTYLPRGTTALLDAIGLTIDRLGEKLSATPESERPGQVIIAILTDGLENASRQYTWKDVAKRIDHQTKVYQWKFLFLGANLDAILTGEKMNIHARDSSNFMMNETSYRAALGAVNRKMTAMRLSRRGPVNHAVLRDAEASMEDLRRDEEHKPC
jgi:hypothetical protein